MANVKRRAAFQEMARREKQRRLESGQWSLSIGDVMQNVGTVASSVIAEPLSGMAGLMTLPYGSEYAASAVDNVRDSLTYQPTSEGAQHNFQKLGYNLEPVTDAIQNLSTVPGDAVYDATGSPFLATMAYSAVPALTEMMALKGIGALNTGKQLEFGDISDLTKTPAGKQRVIFAGVKAKNADLNKLEMAQNLEKSGIDRDEIWTQTGWFKDRSDGQWKYEISDALDWETELGSDIQPRAMQMMRDHGSTPQPDLLHHPEMYDNYPSLKSMRAIKEEGEGGSYRPQTSSV